MVKVKKTLLLLRCIRSYIYFSIARTFISNTQKLYVKDGMLMQKMPTLHLTKKEQTLTHQLHCVVIKMQNYFPFKMNCWSLALAIQLILDREAVPCCLCIGAKKEANKTLGHAWIEIPTKDNHLVINKHEGYQLISCYVNTHSSR